MTNTFRFFVILIWFSTLSIAQSNCNIAAPNATAIANSTKGQCPGGYYSSGSACSPTGSSANYGFENPSSGSCPGGYYRSGMACVASSKSSCYAFYAGGGSCPGGYYKSGIACVSN